MTFINDLLGINLPEAASIAIIVAILLIGLLLIVWILKKIFSRRTSHAKMARQARLSITDVAVVDDDRRIVLVRRDDVEHLIMFGGPNDILIEQNITQLRPAAVPTPSSAANSRPIDSITDDVSSSISKSASGAGAAASAGITAVGASASNASAATSSAGSSLASAASSATQASEDAIANSVSSVKDTILDSDISGSLDSVTAGETTLSEATPSSTDADMQKLLNDLESENKA